MALYRSVSRFIFKVSVRRYQYRSHHGKRTKGRGYHIAHYVAVIILAGPDKSALCFHDSGYGIVDQSIEICDPCGLKFFFVLFVINFLENIFKGVVILFGDSILGGKPQILFCIQSVRETASGKAFNGRIQVMHTLSHSRSLEFMYQLSGFCSVLGGVDQFYFSRSRNDHFCIFIYVSIGMSCQSNGLLPVFYTGFNTFYHDRCAEYGTVQHRTDSPVRAFVHFF